MKIVFFWFFLKLGDTISFTIKTSKIKQQQKTFKCNVNNKSLVNKASNKQCFFFSPFCIWQSAGHASLNPNINQLLHTPLTSFEV